MAITPKRSPRARAASTPHSWIPSTGILGGLSADGKSGIGIAGDDETIGIIPARHNIAQRQGHAFHIRLAFNAERPPGERHTLDRDIRPPERRHRVGHGIGDRLVGVWIDDHDGPHLSAHHTISRSASGSNQTYGTPTIPSPDPLARRGPAGDAGASSRGLDAATGQEKGPEGQRPRPTGCVARCLGWPASPRIDRLAGCSLDAVVGVPYV